MKMEVQQETLRHILTTLQAPLDTQAKELRCRAEEAYINGWYQEALEDFLESAGKNYQDFAVHQAIGNIYLYHRQPAELVKAREAYLKAGKYAAPRSPYHAALGYMHAGFVCYLQGNDDAAIEHAQKAIELSPQFAEAHYNHAKFAAAAGQASVAVESLKEAIFLDQEYAVKARADADFENIEAAVTELLERWIAGARKQATGLLNRLRVEMTDYVMPGVLRQQLDQDVGVLKQKLSDVRTYYDVLTAWDATREFEERWRKTVEQGWGQVVLA